MASPSIAGESNTENLNTNDFDRDVVPKIPQKDKEIHDLINDDTNAERGIILQKSLHTFNCYKNSSNGF